MRYRKLTSTGDYSFGNGQLDFFIDDPAGVGQAVKTRLLLWLGEWFLNTDDGTPYLQGILGKHSQSLADTTIQDQVVNTTDGQGTIAVTNVANYVSTLNPNTRSMSVSMDIDTIYGPTDIQIENYTNY